MNGLSQKVTLAAGILALGGSHCQATDIVIADIPVGDGGERAHHSEPCAESADCHDNEFCDKPTCDATSGRCHHRRVIDFCTTGGAPVCGCDGVTYWNDCLREARGVSSSTNGECVAAAPCSKAESCAVAGAACARLLPEGAACAADAPGTCWVLPPVCPVDGGGAAWTRCDGNARSCTDACTAIRAQVPHRRLPSPECH